MLCKYCQPFQYLSTQSSYMREHHRSLIELTSSANEGCELCTGFIQVMESATLVHEGERINYIELVKKMKVKDFWATFDFKQEFTLYGTSKSKRELIYFDCVKAEIFDEQYKPLKSFLNRAPIQLHSNSEQCFALAKHWLQQCQTDHPLCNDNDIVHQPLPSRLIDVGSPLQDPFLYIPKAGDTATWITLSHCWGGESPLTTTLASLQERCKSIPMSIIPLVFQDAINITRNLGFRYLWVDSLCIIQDSLADWAYESTKMSDIYSGAVLCIAASAASKSSEGIFLSSDRDRHFFQSFATIPYSSSENTEKRNISFRRRTDSDLSDDNHTWFEDNDPLHKRAWVMQESGLSRRCLDFSSRQLLWNCRTSQLSEVFLDRERFCGTYKTEGREIFSVPIPSTPHPSCPNIPPIRLAGADIDPISCWYELLENFMRRDITNAGDRLPAIAGLGIKFKEKTLYTYACGLWREDFHRGLLWAADRSGKRLCGDHIPTWSWASINIPQLHTRTGLRSYSPGYRAEVLSLHVETIGNSEFAPVIQTSLTIRGNCALISSTAWKVIPKAAYIQHHLNLMTLQDFQPNTTISGINNTENIWFIFDEEDLTPTLYNEIVSRGIICMHIAAFSEETSYLGKRQGHNMFHGLILEPCYGEVETFRRIGTMKFSSLIGSVNGWPLRTIRIV